VSTRRLWWANLHHTSPRYEEWLAILGTDDVPLLHPGIVHGSLGHEEGKCDVYLLDLTRLTKEQMDRLVAFVAKKFGAPEEEVCDEILRQGFPIRAADVSICFDVRAFV